MKDNLMELIDDSVKAEELVLRFNKRESLAFGQIYSLFYDELIYFSSRLFQDTGVAPDDVVQEVVMKILERDQLEFNSLEHIKAYMYISIRNHFRNYLSHKDITDKYTETIKLSDDYLISRIVETETLSGLSRVLNLLPVECAKVFKMYLDGWDVKEIAKQLGKSASTVYTQRQEAIDILKKLDLKKLLSAVLLFITASPSPSRFNKNASRQHR